MALQLSSFPHQLRVITGHRPVRLHIPKSTGWLPKLHVITDQDHRSIFDRCPRHCRGSHGTWFSRLHIETFIVGCVISSSALTRIASHCFVSRRAQRMDCDREYRNLCEIERLCEQAIRQVQQRSNTGEYHLAIS